AALPAREGLLLSARPTILTTGTQLSDSLRYLFHVGLRSDACQLTVRTGRGLVASGRWTLSQIAADLRMARHWRTTGGMSLLRLLRLITFPLFLGRSVWIIAERPDTAQDNGFHLFRYLRSQEARRDVYY